MNELMKVKIEVFRPYRKTLQIKKFDKGDLTISELSHQITDWVRKEIPIYLQFQPLIEEIRWEYMDIGQGHYIILDK